MVKAKGWYWEEKALYTVKKAVSVTGTLIQENEGEVGGVAVYQIAEEKANLAEDSVNLGTQTKERRVT